MPKLRVHAATENEFVAIDIHHGLYGHARELIRADFFGYGRLDGAICRTHRRLIVQVQLDPASFCFVSDRVRKNLEHDGKADLRSGADRLIFAGGDMGFYCGNAVQRQQLFGFKLGEQDAAACSSVLNNLLDSIASAALQAGFGERGSFVEAARVVSGSPHVGEGAGCGVGIRKRGIPAALSAASPAAMLLPPIQLASTGLPDPLAYGVKRCAICRGSVIACGARMTSSPSLLGS